MRGPQAFQIPPSLKSLHQEEGILQHHLIQIIVVGHERSDESMLLYSMGEYRCHFSNFISYLRLDGGCDDDLVTYDILQVVWVQAGAMGILVSCLDWSAEARRAAMLVSKNSVKSKPQEGRDTEEGQPW